MKLTGLSETLIHIDQITRDHILKRGKFYGYRRVNRNLIILNHFKSPYLSSLGCILIIPSHLSLDTLSGLLW
jgi:hypothetical protein